MSVDAQANRTPSARLKGAFRRRRINYRRAWRWTLPLLVALLVGGLLGVGVGAAIHMPKVDALADYTPGQITKLYDQLGSVFADYSRERRVLLQEDEIPLILQNAILAAEDSDFFRHGGIDAKGALRAAVKNAVSGRRGMGGSTLTMQVARKLFLTPAKTWKRKIEEAFLSVELEKRLSKQQILTLYCNLFFLGHGNYGMASAANFYFSKGVDELTIPEAATLAGIVQRPSSYSPYRKPELVIRRRDYVLGRMLQESFITQVEHDDAVSQPLSVVGHGDLDETAPYFAEDVRRYLEQKFGTTALLEKGLQVSTTLDPRIQAAAEKALRDGLRRLDRRKAWRGPIGHVDLSPAEAAEASGAPATAESRLDIGVWAEGIVQAVNSSVALVRFGDRLLELGTEGIRWTRKRRPSDLLKPGDIAWFTLAAPTHTGADPVLLLEQEPEIEGAVVVLESSTGAVRAMVGGWSFERSKFNRATQARRQVGSAFKPLLYGAALEAGFSGADTILDAPAAFRGATNQDSYSPRNYYRKYYGIITLRRAFELSANVTAVKLIDLVGIDRVVEFAQRSGIDSPLPPYPSLALGSADLSPIELASAYAAIGNRGTYLKPYLVERVNTPDGTVLEQHVPQARKAMEPEIAYLTTSLMEGVVDRGTATALRHLDLDLAGKTGTTDSYSDAWFAGFTPKYAILCWVGYDVKRSLGRNMTGSEAALPIWRQIVETGLQEGWLVAGERFAAPSGIVFQPVEYFTGLLPGPGATRIITETFLEGTQPAQLYEPQWTQVMSLPWFQQRAFYIPKDDENMPEDIRDWSLVREAWGRD